MSAPPPKTGPPARAAAAHTVHAAYLWPRRPRAVIPEGPHHRDVPLRDIIDILLTARPAGLSVEGANPRQAQWNVFQTVRLPEGKVLIPGVFDTTTNFIEHPELVAQQIVHYARMVGRENVIAGVDCGFATFAGRSTGEPAIAWTKLGAMVEGARLASRELWG